MGQNRAADAAARVKLAGEQAGWAVSVGSVESVGEQGHDEFITGVKALLEDDYSALPWLANVGNHLDAHSRKVLNAWYKKYAFYKKAVEKKEKAIGKIKGGSRSRMKRHKEALKSLTSNRDWALHKMEKAIAGIELADATLLAPHRRAEIRGELVVQVKLKVQNKVIKKVPKTVISITFDPDPSPGPEITPIVVHDFKGDNEKAILSSIPTVGPQRTSQKVDVPQFKGRRGYQKPNTKSNWTQRGPV